MQAELKEWARNKLEEAVREVPDDVLVHTVQRSGHAGPEIVDELERGSYDLIVLGSRGRRRAQEGLLGSSQRLRPLPFARGPVVRPGS
jgi:nucleotide-binding universal stress UspA family protein